MAQASYTRKIVRGRGGRLFGSHHVIETLFLETGIVLFGYGVKAGSEEQDAVLVAAPITIADFRGVAVLDPSIERIYKSEDDPTYTAENNNAMDVVRKGMIEVVPTTLVVRGDPPFMQHTSNTYEPGEFHNVSDGGNAIDISSVASWFRGNENIGEVAVLELHIIK